MHSYRVLLVTILLAGTVAGCGSHRPKAAPPIPPNAGGSSRPPSATPSQVAPARPGPFGASLPVFAAPPPPQPITAPAGPTAPIYHRLPVHQPVAFLTMDDGLTRLPVAPALMRAAHVPFTMFLIAPVAAQDPLFFQQLAADGGGVEDHTLTHPSMRGLSYATQRHQICGARDSLHATFGVTPRFFRPPYGNYDHNTLKAVHDCGLRAAFAWSETVRGGKVYYQTPTHKIEPGDIILMHFRSTFVRDVIAALTAIHNAGLTPALLEDYVV